MRSAGARRVFDQTLSSKGLVVPPVLVLLLARVAYHLARAANHFQLLGKVQQRHHAQCFLLLYSRGLLLIRVGIKLNNSILHTPQGRHNHASQRQQHSGKYRLRTG